MPSNFLLQSEAFIKRIQLYVNGAKLWREKKKRLFVYRSSPQIASFDDMKFFAVKNTEEKLTKINNTLPVRTDCFCRFFFMVKIVKERSSSDFFMWGFLIYCQWCFQRDSF